MRVHDFHSNTLSTIFLSMFQSIRLKSQRRTSRRRELVRKLEAVEKGQQEISALVASLVAAEIKELETIGELRDDLRPSWIAWTQAAILFALSAVILLYAARATVNESSISYNVYSLHQEAQAERTIAFEGTVAYLANPSRNQGDMPSVFNSALKQLRAADNVDAEADGFENGISGEQLRTQITLGLGSAFFGAVAAWILTQLLTWLRWKRKVKPTGSA